MTKKIEVQMFVSVPTLFSIELEVPSDGIQEPEDAKLISEVQLEDFRGDIFDHFCSADWQNFYQSIEEALEK